MEKFPKMKISEEYFEDGYFRVEMEGYIGKNHYQRLLIYEPHGELIEVSHFKNGKDHGLYQIFNNDKICQDGYYLDGKLHGKITFYRDNGSVRRWEVFKNGKWIKSSDGMSPGEKLVKFFNDNKLDYKKLPEKYHKNFEK